MGCHEDSSDLKVAFDSEIVNEAQAEIRSLSYQTEVTDEAIW